MKVVVGGKAVSLKDQDLLGEGGEAKVYRHSGRAVKIFHPVSSILGDKTAKSNWRAAIVLKEKKVAVFPAGLPSNVMGPESAVADAKGNFVGYVMGLVDGAHDVAKLSQKRFRRGSVSNENVTVLFRDILKTVQALHAKQVVVGDFNDSNVLFVDTSSYFIDCDSMQFGGHPCQVGHERFLDPDLYGVDLMKKPAFSTGSDWYSFCVLLFQSLLYVHPYGGVHKDHKTMLRRAEAKYSVLRSDVIYPKSATHFSVLPDSVLSWCEKVFDKGDRTPFPAALLDIRWTACSCGAEHGLRSCPVCKKIEAMPAVSFKGNCSTTSIFKTSGLILRMAVQGQVRYLYRRDGVVYREDGSKVMEGHVAPSVRFAISGSSTWIGLGEQLVKVQAGQIVDRTSTGNRGLYSIFDANSRSCYLTNHGWIIDQSTTSRVGQILDGQTWFKVGELLGFGFYRAGNVTVAFLFNTNRPRIKNVMIPPIRGGIREASAVFDDHHVLFSVSTDNGGKIVNSMYLINEDGQIVGSISGSPDDERMLGNIRGKALARGNVVCPTDEGLLSLAVDSSGTFRENKLFDDTEPFVEAGAGLYSGPGGSVYVVTAREITQLTLS